jgi:predicted type IV restriction endonuclease
LALKDFGVALSNAPAAIQQQWEQAGMLSALTVLDQLQQLGYKLEQGVEVASVRPGGGGVAGW